MPDLNTEKTSPQLKRKIPSTAVIVGIIAVFIIFVGLLLYYLPEEPEKIKPSISETPSEAPEFTIPEVLRNLVGTIKKLEENVIVFEATIPQVDKDNKLVPKKETRKAIIIPTTNFTSLTFIIHEETGKKVPKEIGITFEDLKVGDYIEVLSGQNISKAEEFEVSKVRIISSQK